MSSTRQSAVGSRRVPYWVPPEVRGAQVADTAFTPARSFRYRRGDTYHPQFLVDVRALGNAIVAEGDSWFNFPYAPHSGFWDLVEVLEDRGRKIVSKAHYGDLLDDMVYGGLYQNGTVRAP